MAVKVKLTSVCNVKNCEGKPGDVVEFKDEKLAERIVSQRGGSYVREEKPEPVAEPKKG